MLRAKLDLWKLSFFVWKSHWRELRMALISFDLLKILKTFLSTKTERHSKPLHVRRSKKYGIRRSNHKESVGPTIGHSVYPSVRPSVHPFVGRSELPQNVPIYPKMFINVHASLPSLFRSRHYSKKWFLILNAWKYLELNASFRPGSKERKKV